MGSEEFPVCTRILSIPSTWEEFDYETGKSKQWAEVEIERFDRNGYEAAKKDWDGYKAWKDHRNPARAAIEAEHGFDLKHAVHLIRLLRTGYEILTTGQLHVFRPDAEELMTLRNGAWSYDRILEYSKEIEAKLEEAEATSPLPWGPDWNKIEELQMQLLEERLEAEYES